MKNPHHATRQRRVAGLLALAFSSSAVAAPTFTVDSTADAVDDHPGDGVCHAIAGACTLRAAIMEANRASGAGATIDLPAGIYTLQIPATASDDESSGDLDLATPVSGNPLIMIAGAGAAATIIDANQIDRVMRIESSRTATISGVTLRGGYSMDGGGGLLNGGTLVLDQVDITQNTADSNNGGGIYNVGQITLDHVDVGPHNQATLSGGGIFNVGTLALGDSSVFANQGSTGGGLENAISATITRSTFSGNRADDGGGIRNFGVLAIVDSTIAGNRAQHSGGGIGALGHGNFLAIYSSTIAGNFAYADDGSDGAGGGLYFDTGVVNVGNSLLVGNYYNGFQGALEDCYTDGTAVLHAFGADLFTAAGTCNVDTSGGSWSLLNSLDLLGPLDDNGGPTQTIGLLAGSNAIDAGITCSDPDGNPLLTDQRGLARIVGSACDIGAYESDPDRIFANGFD